MVIFRSVFPWILKPCCWLHYNYTSIKEELSLMHFIWKSVILHRNYWYGNSLSFTTTLNTGKAKYWYEMLLLSFCNFTYDLLVREKLGKTKLGLIITLFYLQINGENILRGSIGLPALFSSGLHLQLIHWRHTIILWHSRANNLTNTASHWETVL